MARYVEGGSYILLFVQPHEARVLRLTLSSSLRVEGAQRGKFLIYDNSGSRSAKRGGWVQVNHQV